MHICPPLRGAGPRSARGRTPAPGTRDQLSGAISPLALCNELRTFPGSPPAIFALRAKGKRMSRDDTSAQHSVVLVSGPSGAGRSTAINALEDFGFEAIDNIPLSLIPRLFDSPDPPGRSLALGVDVRTRDFSAGGLLEIREMLDSRENLRVELLYLDASAEVLARRYSETRRRHPMAPAETPADGIAREMILLEEVRNRDDILIDTS
ncbi:unnamed protein product, partial [Cyprideis torosa]